MKTKITLKVVIAAAMLFVLVSLPGMAKAQLPSCNMVCSIVNNLPCPIGVVWDNACLNGGFTVCQSNSLTTIGPNGGTLNTNITGICSGCTLCDIVVALRRVGGVNVTGSIAVSSSNQGPITWTAATGCNGGTGTITWSSGVITIN